MMFVCRHCGNNFSPKYKIQSKSNPTYCSATCYHEACKTGVNKVCIECGKSFYVYRGRKEQEYCSLGCRKKYKNVEKICPRCGKKFTVLKLQQNVYIHCSLKCRHKNPKRKCVRCGGQFRPKRPDIKHCSEKCRRPPVYKYCLHCKKKFRIVPAISETRRFCSFSCYRKYSGETRLEKKFSEALFGAGLDFYQEFQIGGYCIDFFIPDSLLCVEADGNYWHSSERAKKFDKQRDNLLTKNGFIVMRFKEDEIKKNTEACINQIIQISHL